MTKIRKRFVTRGPKVGVCNICGDYGDLTEDHTPPKGAVRVTQVEMNYLINFLSAEKPEKGRISQNGMKFRTLCANCNNKLLGLNYDLAFNDFAQKVKAYLFSEIEIPKIMPIKGKPQKIARALYGHLCAVGVNQYYESEQADEMRKWFLDESLPMPDFIEIKYWVYPYKKQILIRNAGLRDLRVEGNLPFWLMKFFPLAFFILWDKPEGYGYPMLGSFKKFNLLINDDEVEIPINLSIIPHERWPETPTSNSFLLMGDGAVGAIER